MTDGVLSRTLHCRVSGGALAVTNDTKGAHNIAPVLKEFAVSLGVT